MDTEPSAPRGRGRHDNVVGTERDPVRIARWLTQSQNALLIGAPGVGKSFLLSEVEALLAQDGIAPMRLAGIRALQDVRMGAVNRTTDSRVVDLFEAADREDGFSRPSQRKRSIVIVDDAEYLDEATTDALLKLLYTDTACALLALNAREPAQTASEAASTRHSIIELWSSGMAHRVDLGDLVHADADRLISIFTADVPIDTVARAALYEWSGGSRLILRELCTLAASRVTRGLLAWDPDDTEAPVVDDVVRSRLADLPDDAALALALVHRITALSYARATRLVRPTTIAALINARLIVESGHPVRRLYVSPVVGGVASALVSPATLENLVDAVLARAAEDHGALAPPGPGVGTELAYRWLRGEGDPPSEHYRAEVFTSAAHTAAARGEHDLAATFAREALRDGQGGDAVGLLAISLLAVGEIDAASALIEDWATREGGHTPDVIALWTAVAVSLPATGTLDTVERRLRTAGSLTAADTVVLDSGRALGRLLALDVQGARTSAEAVLAAPEAPSAATLAAALTSALAACMAGDTHAATEGIAYAERLNRDATTGRIRSPETAAVIIATEAVCRIVTGMSVEVLEPKVARLLADAVVTDDRLSLGLLGWVSGMRAAFHGDLELALADASAARHRLSAVLPGAAVPLRAQEALLLTELGRLDEARAMIDALPTSTSWPFVDGILVFVRARTAGEDVPTDETGVLLIDAHMAYRAGLEDPRGFAARLTRLQAKCENALVSAMAAHIQGLATDAAEPVARAAQTMSELHAYGWAELAYTGAAEIEERHGNRRHAAELTALSHAAAAHSGGRPHGGHDEGPVASLTPREREIARLAAEGRSNKEIANVLFVSVRTVESHLYQVRAKLGAPSRRALAGLLDGPGDDDRRAV